MPDNLHPKKGVKETGKAGSSNVFRRVYDRFVKIRGRPREIALGFALGIFIGMTPTMGIQMPIAVFIAALFKCSKISAVFGVWITNPITSPFIYGITYIVGAKLLGLKAVMTLPENLTWSFVMEMLKNAPVIFGALTVGGILIGLPLSILCYVLAYSAVNKYQQRIRAKMAARKARLVDSKEKLKKEIRKRRTKK